MDTGAPIPGDIHDRAGFDAAVLWALRTALARPSRRLLLVDPDFTGWPLGQVAVLTALQSWLQLPQRRLVLLADDYSEVPRQHPRFVAWRRDWAHAVQTWSLPRDASVVLPSLLLDDGPLCLLRLSSSPLRATAMLDAHEARRWRVQVDGFLQQSEAAFPVHTVGL